VWNSVFDSAVELSGVCTLRIKMEKEILKHITRLQNPVRYLGGEINSYSQEFKGKVRIALGYPDIYEIGMSSLGIRILYGMLNERDDCVCERFFSPDTDMEKLIKEKKIPLFTVDSQTPVKDFDVVGFSLSSELNYTNMLNLLELSGIPVFSKDRSNKFPLVIVGGSCSFNPSVLVPFADAFVIGEGEDAMTEIVSLLSEEKKPVEKKDILEKLSDIQGVYVPAFPRHVKKRTTADFENSFFPVKWLMPLTEVVHDRISLEIMRGCGQGCKFCQAGFCWRPVRSRSPEKMLHLAKESYRNSGYEEISLLSFSSGDHPKIKEIIDLLIEEFREKKVSLSFPSLRIDTFSFRLAGKMKEIKKTGLTFAPETGQRLREIIGKKIKDSQLINLVENAKSEGWRQIKLYFMIGLPGETHQDLSDIAELINNISRIIRVKAAFNTFIPKPHTPLERERFISEDEFTERKNFLIEKLKRNRYVKYNFHPYHMSCVETFLARGEEKLAPVIYRVFKEGGRMENWRENFDFRLWEEACRKENIDMRNYLDKLISPELPWSFIKI
jgi:radical SAM superfamily enzyme YgiQ (UPF0313 family)